MIIKMKKGIITLLWLSLCLGAITPPASAAAWEQGKVFSSHTNSGQKIALTFDDGPHCRYTAQILDILKEYEIPATFFVIGENAEQYPELIRREIAEGHEVANHTYHHVYLQKAKKEVMREEILGAERILYEIADYRPKLIRPPGGLYNKTVCDAATELDYRVVLWTIDTRDWEHNSVSAITELVLENIHSGDIILFHDFIGGKKSPTPEALRRIIPELLDMGFQFVTVSDLIHSD